MIGFHGDTCMENEPYSTLRVHEQTHAGPVSGPSATRVTVVELIRTGCATCCLFYYSQF